MDKLKDMVKKELKSFEEQGINSSNLPTISELVDVLKDMYEIDEKRGEYDMRYQRSGMRNYYGPTYREYDDRMNYQDDSYNYPGRRPYRHSPMEYLFEKINRLMENMEYYIDGKDRYHDGAHSGHMTEGLEKTMYAVCTLIESLMDSAETAEEKEIIRKHIEKIKNI